MRTLDADREGPPPKAWKSIGDEIVFCCRAKSLRHIAECVEGFQDALAAYGEVLDAAGRYLNVKGSGWIAAFPTPNITVAIDRSNGSDRFDEASELTADDDPLRVDFLGNAIDAGFRLGRHATPDRFVVSVELAWLLTKASKLGCFHSVFSYHQREILKGILRDRPYPIVALDSERQPERKELRSHERQLNGDHVPDVVALHNFLQSFIKLEGIEFPMVPESAEASITGFPASYNAFLTSWNENSEVEAARDAIEREAEETGNAGGAESLPPEVEKSMTNADAESHRRYLSQSTDPDASCTDASE